MPPEHPHDPSGGPGAPAVAPEPAAPPPPQKSKRTLLWVSSTYFGEGLPWSFLHQMGTEYLTAIGASKTQISSTSLLHLAVTLKFLWSPAVDLFGTKRRWLWVTQLLLGLGMFVVAAVAPTGNLTIFWRALAVLAVLHATHDIACDGFYLRALDAKEQALYSGVRNAGYRIAMLVGKSLLVVLAGQTSWFWGFGAAGALMILVAGANALVMPRPSEPKPVKEKGAGTKMRAALAAYKSFIFQPQAPVVLSFMFLYRLGDIMMFAMATPLLKDIGIDTSLRGTISGISTVVEIGASLLGGAIISRLGLARCLTPMIYIQNLAIPLYIVIAVLKPGFWGVLPLALAEKFASGLGIAGNAVFLMQRSRSVFSASHFAFATALVSLGSTLSGFVSGPINQRVGHPTFFVIAFLASVPSLILVLFVPKNPIETTTSP
ncbi:MAG: MFS transporter [Pseudomonadota bacterium]